MSNQAVGGVYQTIIDEVINSSRVDFEESGVEEAVLEELRQVSKPHSLDTVFPFSVRSAAGCGAGNICPLPWHSGRHSSHSPSPKHDAFAPLNEKFNHGLLKSDQLVLRRSCHCQNGVCTHRKAGGMLGSLEVESSAIWAF
jgi:hypothetical protein